MPPDGGVGAENALESVEARFDANPAPTAIPTPKSPSCAKRGGKAQGLARERNPAWDALAEIEGHGGNPSPIAAGGIGRALKAIRSMMPGADLPEVADEIKRRARNWSAHFQGATISAMALAKWWAKMDNPPEVKPKPGGWAKHAAERDAGLRAQGDWSAQFADSMEERKTV